MACDGLFQCLHLCPPCQFLTVLVQARGPITTVALSLQGGACMGWALLSFLSPRQQYTSCFLEKCQRRGELLKKGMGQAWLRDLGGQAVWEKLYRGRWDLGGRGKALQGRGKARDRCHLVGRLPHQSSACAGQIPALRSHPTSWELQEEVGQNAFPSPVPQHQQRFMMLCAHNIVQSCGTLRCCLFMASHGAALLCSACLEQHKRPRSSQGDQELSSLGLLTAVGRRALKLFPFSGSYSLEVHFVRALYKGSIRSPAFLWMAVQPRLKHTMLSALVACSPL